MANYGAVYLAGINNPDFSDTNNIIYGHNLLNGSMFHQLETFTNQEAFDEHRTIYFLTPAGNYRLVTFADVNVRATDPVVQAQFASPEEYTSYVQDKIDKSTVTPAEGMPEASSISQTFAFSTCDHDHSGDKRYVLFSYVAEFVAANSTSGSSSSIVDNSTAEDINSAQGDLL